MASFERRPGTAARSTKKASWVTSRPSRSPRSTTMYPPDAHPAGISKEAPRGQPQPDATTSAGVG